MPTGGWVLLAFGAACLIAALVALGVAVVTGR